MKDPKEWRIEIDLDEITYEEVREVNEDWQKAVQERDDSYLHRWAAKCVTAWEFKGDPSDVLSYKKLGVRQHKEVMTRFATEWMRFLGYVTGDGKVDISDQSGRDEPGHAESGDSGDGDIIRPVDTVS